MSAGKDKQLVIVLPVPQGMSVSVETLRELGVNAKDKLSLQLKRSHYGLKQVSGLLTELLSTKLLTLDLASECLKRVSIIYGRLNKITRSNTIRPSKEVRADFTIHAVVSHTTSTS